MKIKAFGRARSVLTGIAIYAGLIGVWASAAAQEKELRIDRIPDKRGELFYNLVVKPWADKNGVKITQSTYNSDEQMLANIRATPGPYDLAYMGGTSVFRGAKLGLLEAIVRAARLRDLRNPDEPCLLEL